MTDLIEISEAQSRAESFLEEKIEEEGNELENIEHQSVELDDVEIGDEGIGIYRVKGEVEISTGHFSSEEQKYKVQVDAESGKIRGFNLFGSL